VTHAATVEPVADARTAAQVLLVEDNRDYARLVREMLADEWPGGLQLAHFEQLGQASTELASSAPDCVLLDLTLSDARGLEALSRVLTVAPAVPVVVLTNHDDEAIGLAAVQEGAQDYLVKGRSDGRLIARSIRYAIERKRAQLQLAHQALHDALTGLPNRALFLDRLERSLMRGERRPVPVAVLFLDVDTFKLINDSLGHEAGDDLLVQLARRLEGVVRPSDTVARFGGDEFTILCEQLASEYDAVAIARRVAEEIRHPFTVEGHELFVTASVGIAYTQSPESDPTTLVRNADAAMYRAKERGGARYEVFDEVMRARAVRRLEMQSGLHRAVERGELHLHYQPQVNMRTGAIVGVEGLLRWEHPSRGLLEAGEFIALAEDTGLIKEIGEWVITVGCHQLRAWQDDLGERAPSLSLNVSPAELSGVDIAGRIAAVLRETGASPAGLCIELTERGVLDDQDHAARALDYVRDLGVRIALDDFGTGQASIGYLDRFRIDVLKIDRSLLADLGPGWHRRRLVAATISMAMALGVSTVAEGVERSEQVRELLTLGCDVGQGFHFAPALPAGDLERLLRSDAQPGSET
jgi:diguanylate cyclase (GGDEF)-like protein